MSVFQAGQRWTYAAPLEITDSHILIGAIVEYEGGRRIVCCAVTGALDRAENGTLERITIPFLPMTVDALSQTVIALDGTAPLPDAFATHFTAWTEDARGASYFTVPFEGSLERMIALQMAAIVDQT